MSDVSVRWVQLDDDPELEAILITEAREEGAYAAFIFDEHVGWNLVGSFFGDQRGSDGQNLIRVEKLTEDSPTVLLMNRDLGGMGSTILTSEVFQLRQGGLWPVLQATNRLDVLVPSPPLTQTQHVRASSDRLVMHTVREQPPGRIVKNECEVLRWNSTKQSFAPADSERSKYCDMKSGRPLPGKSQVSRFPMFP